MLAAPPTANKAQIWFVSILYEKVYAAISTVVELGVDSRGVSSSHIFTICTPRNRDHFRGREPSRSCANSWGGAFRLVRERPLPQCWAPPNDVQQGRLTGKVLQEGRSKTHLKNRYAVQPWQPRSISCCAGCSGCRSLFHPKPE